MEIRFTYYKIPSMTFSRLIEPWNNHYVPILEHLFHSGKFFSFPLQSIPVLIISPRKHKSTVCLGRVAGFGYVFLASGLKYAVFCIQPLLAFCPLAFLGGMDQYRFLLGAKWLCILWVWQILFNCVLVDGFWMLSCLCWHDECYRDHPHTRLSFVFT